MSERLSISLLGVPTITRQAGACTAANHKVLALLAYLACSGEAHSRAGLAELLWDEPSPERASANLRQVLWLLKRDYAPWLTISREAAGMVQEDSWWPDVAELRAALAEAGCSRQQGGRLGRGQAARLQEAVARYRGEFMAGFGVHEARGFEEWLCLQREALHRDACNAFGLLADHYLALRAYTEGVEAATRLVALDELDESAQRRLMTLLALDGQPQAALTQFDACARLLAAELGVKPNAETTALAKRIRRGGLKPLDILADNPYKGLKAFTAGDANDFYGREAFLDRLSHNLNTRPVTVIIAPSGHGKSSIVQAGVAALVCQRSTADEQPAPADWVVLRMRPGAAPFQALAEQLLITQRPALSTRPSHLQAEAAELAASLHQGAWGVAAAAAHYSASPQPAAARILLIVDQFEELYGQCDDPELRQRFIQALLTAAQPPADARVPADSPAPALTLLLALRADFAAPALACGPLGEAIQQGGLILSPMSREELRRAIEEPARSRGVSFEAGLVDRLLEDAGGQPGCLPLLQFTLTELWLRQEHMQLTHAGYLALGGMAGALQTHAERVFDALPAADQAQAPGIFSRLMHIVEDASPARRLAVRAEFSDDAWRLAQMLSDTRLLVTALSPGGVETAELAHEALIEHWPRLRDWAASDREFALWLRRLDAGLEQWQRRRRDERALLKDLALDEAVAWRQDRAADLSEAENQFIATSVARRQRELDAEEAARRREFQQAQALAAAERERAELALQSRTRLRRLAAGLGVTLVLALLAALAAIGEGRQARQQAAAAVVERSRAEAQARLALSRQLGAQAINLTDEELDTALLLSVEALQLAPDRADRNALLAELTLPPLLAGILHGPAEPLHHLAFDPRDASLLSAGESGMVLRWDLASGRSLGPVLPPSAINPATFDVATLAFSADGRLAAVADGPGFSVWDLTRGEVIFSPPAQQPTAIHLLFFTADGSRLLTDDQEGNSLLWQVSGEPDAGDGPLLVWSATEEPGVVRALSPAGDKIALRGQTDDGQLAVLLWDVKAGRPIGQPMPGHTADIHGWTFNDDGSLLATASFDGSVRLWDAVRGAPLLKPLLAHDGRVLSVAFSPDSATLASGGTDGLIYLWDTATGELAGPALAGHGNWVRSLLFSADGHTLVSADADGKILVWDLGKRRTLSGHRERVRGVAASPDGRTLITSGFDKAIGFWDARTGERVGWIQDAHQRSIIQVALSPDGRMLASGDAGGAVMLWDAETHQALHPPLLGHGDVVISLAFSPDGTLLASGDFGGMVKLWDTGAGVAVSDPLAAHEGWASSLAFSPDGALLASGGTAGDIRLWRVLLDETKASALQPLGEPLIGHDNWVTALAFSPDGTTLVSTSSDRTIRIWDVATGQPRGEPLLGHQAQVWSAQFDRTSAGRVLVTLGSDGSVLRWDMDSRELLGPPLLTGAETETMSLSSDGASLLLGSFGSTAWRWGVDQTAWPERACRIANRNLSEAEWQQFMGDRPYHKTCPSAP